MYVKVTKQMHSQTARLRSESSHNWRLCRGLFQSKQSTGPAEIRGPREKLPSSESAWHVSKERLAIAHRGYSHVYTVVPRCDLYRQWGRRSTELTANLPKVPFIIIKIQP